MSTPVLTSVELHDRLRSGAPPTLLDVRTPAEYETAHIVGAYNVPLDVVRQHRAEIRERLDGDVVFVCRSGQRATQAEEVLRGEGLEPGLCSKAESMTGR